MKKQLLIPLLVGLMIGAAGCSGTTKQKKTDTTVKTDKNKKHYTCTMHPEIITDKPGTCSKCGMDLVEKEDK